MRCNDCRCRSVRLGCRRTLSADQGSRSPVIRRTDGILENLYARGHVLALAVERLNVSPIPPKLLRLTNLTLFRKTKCLSQFLWTLSSSTDCGFASKPFPGLRLAKFGVSSAMPPVFALLPKPVNLGLPLALSSPRVLVLLLSALKSSPSYPPSSLPIARTSEMLIASAVNASPLLAPAKAPWSPQPWSMRPAEKPKSSRAKKVSTGLVGAQDFNAAWVPSRNCCTRQPTSGLPGSAASSRCPIP